MMKYTGEHLTVKSAIKTLFYTFIFNTLVKTADRESLIKKSIQQLSASLDPAQFWRIHRGTIINVSQISEVTRSFGGRYLVRLKDLPVTLTVSRSYAHLFKQM
jgi:DNA-binding LytR/AlgR family response regulator